MRLAELDQQRRELEVAGIVLRTEHPTVPPSVEYSLTALGRQLHATLDDLQRQLGTPALGR